jgi:hypothetical protein
MTERRPLRLMTALRRAGDEGMSLILVLLSMSALAVLALGITGLGVSAVSSSVNERETSEALAIADAGIAHARRLVLWQEWPSLNIFLQNASNGADGEGCTGDELAGPPAGALPTGYPTAVGDFIPAAGRAFGRGSYRVFVCDDDLTDFDTTVTPPVLNVDPDVDVNKRLLVRSIGTGPNGATASVEMVIAGQPLPALIVNGNLRISGNPQLQGRGGASHANGSTLVDGNPCAHQFYGSVTTVTVSGRSAGSGTNCSPSAIDTRPDSAPVNVPLFDPLTFKPQATYWLESNGLAYDGATGAVIPTPSGWNWSSNNYTWSGNSNIAAGTYWVNANVQLSGSPGSTTNPLPFTLFATLSVHIGGNPQLTPNFSMTGPGQQPIGVAVIAGTDLNMAGSPGQEREGLFYARHQLDVTGDITIEGQLIAANVADTTYAPKTFNLVPLDANGDMRVSGSPNIVYNGNGYMSAAPVAWRECRTSNDPTNPCGNLWGGP